MGKLKMIGGGPTYGQNCVRHPDRKAVGYLWGSWDGLGPDSILGFYCRECWRRARKKFPDLKAPPRRLRNST